MNSQTRNSRTRWGWLTITWVCWTALTPGCQRISAPPIPDPQPQSRTTSEPRVDASYIQWLEAQSMLGQARRQALGVSGKGVQWRHPYGQPQPRQVVRRASVWLL